MEDSTQVSKKLGTMVRIGISANGKEHFLASQIIHFHEGLHAGVEKIRNNGPDWYFGKWKGAILDIANHSAQAKMSPERLWNRSVVKVPADMQSK
jgi:hypothetical protein